MKLLTASILIFLLIGGYIIYNAGNMDLKDGDDRKLFLFTFSGWVVNVGRNVVEITGSAISMGLNKTWLPENNNTLNYSIVE